MIKYRQSFIEYTIYIIVANGGFHIEPPYYLYSDQYYCQNFILKIYISQTDLKSALFHWTVTRLWHLCILIFSDKQCLL